MLSPQDIKKNTGEAAAAIVQPGMTVGIGTGSTAYWLILALGEKVKAGLDICCVPTSTHTAQLATEHALALTTLNEVTTIDVTIDGADEIDPAGQLIKGGGGALLQEKMVAAASRELVIIADHTKLVSQLGAFPLPVEVVPFGWKQVQQRIETLYRVKSALRLKDQQPLTTDHGHYILDVQFRQIEDPAFLNTILNTIPGVVDNGLFIDLATQTLIGYPDGSVKSTYFDRLSR